LADADAEGGSQATETPLSARSSGPSKDRVLSGLIASWISPSSRPMVLTAGVRSFPRRLRTLMAGREVADCSGPTGA
jgi:hypothetical protein